ncbi:MAG: twin-arginine translocase subunit TatC [Odoribacter sp.]
MEDSNEENMTFWDHLDELRKVFFRMVIAILLFALIAFVHKEILFDIILAPHQSDFILYRFLNILASECSMPSLHVSDLNVELINIQLTSQFMIHLSTAFYAGLLLASPYIIYQLFSFISPALHTTERKTCLKVMIPAFLLFIIGLLLNYYIIFPLSFRFLATYQVSDLVVNKISLSSYISTFTMLSLLMGAAFEIPIVAYFLAKLGFIHTEMLKKFRKHSLIGILLLAAIITPTADVFTLLLVSIPLYLLYELSILIVAKTQKS